MRTVTVGITTLLICLLLWAITNYESATIIRHLPPTASLHKRWVVVTTIQAPTDAIRRFASIPDWQLLVIGDRKTPSTWVCPGTIFLSIQDQEKLGYSIISKLPYNSYARKNVGYLYAIQHGAEVIYESDDDNLLLDTAVNLTHFFEASTTAFMYATEASLINPYAHFGQASIWPRGFPLGAVGTSVPHIYRTIDTKRMLVRQAVALGDPDVDAIFRLTRKIDEQPLNVQFDASAPPAALPVRSFAPWNSQTTYFAYDALWGMLIPSTTSFRVCDIWRSYITQRLLWEVAGYLAFYPPAVYQDRNAHDYLRDFIEEKALYEDAGRLVNFLRDWIAPPGARDVLSLLSALGREFAKERFWGQGDAALTEAWIADLRAVGYLPPPLRAPSAPTTALIKWSPKRFCAPGLTTSHSLYPRTQLIVVFATDADYINVAFLRSIYAHAFRSIVFYGPRVSMDVEACNHTATQSGDLAYKCVTQALLMGACSDCDGYLVLRSDVVLNWWMIASLDFGAPWLPSGGASLPLSSSSNEPPWSSPMGLPAVRRAYSALPQARLAGLSSCGDQQTAWSAPAHLFYLPGSFANGWLGLEPVFSTAQVHVNIAVASLIQIIGACPPVTEVQGHRLPESAEPLSWRSLWNTSSGFVQPVNLRSAAGRGALKELFVTASECTES